MSTALGDTSGGSLFLSSLLGGGIVRVIFDGGTGLVRTKVILPRDSPRIAYCGPQNSMIISGSFECSNGYVRLEGA